MAVVTAVSVSPKHGPDKQPAHRIRILEGLGVEGDAHCGATVQHRSRARQHPDMPNLRQVHLIPAELHDELAAAGFAVAPGAMGENITTRGVDLLALPVGARLALGDEAVVELTGLRNPCRQLDGVQPGLMAATLDRDASGALVRKAGVMGVVLRGGAVSAGDAVAVTLPQAPHEALQPV